MTTIRDFPIGWLLAMLGITSGVVGAEQQTKPEYDATFVSTIAPERVMAQEVFPVTITMRNTGTQTWEGWSIRLRSVNPRNDRTWGTAYILIAQGLAVKAGEEYAFRSHLRAPAGLGKANFQWQVCKDGETWFGEVTSARTVEVVGRPTAECNTMVGDKRTSAGKKVHATGRGSQ